METLVISAVQLSSSLGDKNKNYEKVKYLINRDIKENPDIIVLPEVWNIGWSPKIFQENAETVKESPSLALLTDIAKRYNSWVIGGSIILENSGKYYNSIPVLNRNGDLIAIYSKNHLFSYYGSDEGKYITSGNSPVMVNVEGVKVGLTICYDIRFPEIFRAYRKAGADVLINCAAWGLKKPIPWECMTRSRAVENQCYMVALTQSGYIENDEWNIGHSRIIDYKGESLTEICEQKEGVITSTLDLSEMYNFRNKCRCIDDIKENYEVKLV